MKHTGLDGLKLLHSSQQEMLLNAARDGGELNLRVWYSILIKPIRNNWIGLLGKINRYYSSILSLVINGNWFPNNYLEEALHQ